MSRRAAGAVELRPRARARLDGAQVGSARICHRTWADTLRALAAVGIVADLVIVPQPEVRAARRLA
jgi:hypothetical protein